MDSKIALVGIIVYDSGSAAAANEILHQYGDYVVGRMGIPYRSRGVNIISVTIDAPENVVSALSGKLGQIPGISVKTMIAKEKKIT